MSNVNQQLNGYNPLSYIGTNPYTPINFTKQTFAPGPTDYQNFTVGALWLNTSNLDLWFLAAKAGGVSTWILLGKGTGDLSTLSDTAGTIVFPSATNNIQLTSASGLLTIVAGTNLLTFDLSGDISSSYITNPATGTATPAAGVLTFAGTGGTTISAAGSTVTINSTDVGADSFPTDSGTAAPIAGVLNILAQNATLGCGSSVLFSAPSASNTVQLDVTDSDGNTIIGAGSGNLTLTSTDSVVLGDSSAPALTSSPGNTVIGAGSATLLAGGSGLNTIVGKGTATALVGGTKNILLGAGAATNLTSTDSNNICIGSAGVPGFNGQIRIGADTPIGGPNIFIGNASGNNTYTTTLAQNVAVGGETLNSLTTGYYNCCLGQSAGYSITTAQGNCLYGNGTGLLITGDGNTAYGHESMWKASGGGSGLTSGTLNIALGYVSGQAWTGGESYNIAIGTVGVSGESSVTRLGAFAVGETLQTKCFIQGIRGITTGVNDAVAVLIDSAGQLGTTSSSIRYKENVENLPSTLNDLMKLRVTSFDYKNRQSSRKSVGMIAEEVFEVMPDLVVHNQEGEIETIKYQDLCIYLLKAMQEQQAQIELLQSKLQN